MKRAAWRELRGFQMRDVGALRGSRPSSPGPGSPGQRPTHAECRLDSPSRAALDAVRVSDDVGAIGPGQVDGFGMAYPRSVAVRV